MNRLALLLLVLAFGVARAQSPQPAVAGSAQNWSLHTFSDAEGFRELSARGTEVHPAGPNVINVTDLSLTVYSGDATAHIDTMLLSSQANFYSNDKRASGTKGVRVIRDDLEATGTRWTYDQVKKQVTLDGEVQIVFNAELKGLLK